MFRDVVWDSDLISNSAVWILGDSDDIGLDAPLLLSRTLIFVVTNLVSYCVTNAL